MSLDIEDGVQLIAKASDKREEERAWQMWVAEYPHMTRDTFMPFSEYYERIRPTSLSNVNTKPKEQLLAEMNEIRKRFEGSPAPET